MQNEVYESLKKYYEKHGEIMPPTKFYEKFHGKINPEETTIGVMKFSMYLDNLREVYPS